MKKLILLSVTLLASAYASAQNPTDDIYYSSKDKGAQQQAPPVSNFKNGAKEIIYVDKDIDIDKMAAKPLQTGPADSKKDSVRQPAAIYQSNVPADSVYSNDEGYYLNGFNGSKSDFDYAELMRMNYNRKYCIPYYDPRFNDIYMIAQKEFSLRPMPRGFHLITREIQEQLHPLPQEGLLHLFLKHTSAALTINENADPYVQTDMEKIFNRLVKEREPYYDHLLEGVDDMPAHGCHPKP